MPKKHDNPCIQDSRLTKLETVLEQVKEDNEDFQQSLKEHKKTIEANTIAIKEQLATWNAIKYMLGVFLIIFGSLFTLFVWEFIKMI
ncbi:MAG: hypothetical protein ISP01_07345 [Methanobrevibacter arboriphilus]|uniref:Uncharacterized protein n=1 Tax=Methanobrevibacter arboriphilus TaxID=39441 RepID=A0A843AJ45_METAZ|nr:hypothetical protein [Methanobrevibacter arboriphilus]MBF4469206.1 hypothetical protein [Methanobrevibacter arboriphilus]